jgi:GNAT superfamily N-acetyltransferase
VGGEQAQHVGGDALAQTDLDTRVALAEAREQARNVEVAGGHERSDPDAPAQDAAQLVDLRARAVHLGEDAARPGGDRLPRLGRGDTAARAFEERDAQFLLEPSDLVRQRRLGEMELLGGAREVAMARHRLDASQLAAVSHDARLVDHLTALINDVYAIAERGLWRDGFRRTTAPELAGLIRARGIAVATRGGQIAGSIRVHDVADDAGEFGILVAAPDQRGTGGGRALVAFAEQQCRERGRRAMQLELLLPRGWEHPTKEFLKAWYGRIGYTRIRTARMDDAYPELAPLLATPCDLAVYEKPL